MGRNYNSPKSDGVHGRPRSVIREQTNVIFVSCLKNVWGTQTVVVEYICSKAINCFRNSKLIVMKNWSFLKRNVISNFRNRVVNKFLLFSVEQICRFECKITSANILRRCQQPENREISFFSQTFPAPTKIPS